MAEQAAELGNGFAAVRDEIAAVQGELAVLKWMVGANIALTILVLGGLLWR